jgi:hypothetical protein
MIHESFYNHYFNNIYWQNHPGEISLLGKNNQFTETERISLALWQSILGGAVGTDDEMVSWNEEQLRFFRFLEPNKRQQNAFLPFWPDLDEIKVAVRVYKQQNSWGVLFFNDKNIPVAKRFFISDLIEKDTAFVFSWKPEVTMPFGSLAEIEIELGPHQSRLFYFSKENKYPPEGLTLGGKTSDAL